MIPKKYYLFIILFTIFLNCNSSYACHENDINLRGHNPKLRYAGISQSVEILFAYTSTSTNCDFYTNFIKKNYKIIAENLSKGEGEFFNAFLTYLGCSREVKNSLKKIIRDNYDQLFKNNDQLGSKFYLRLKKILNQSSFDQKKCLRLDYISLS